MTDPIADMLTRIRNAMKIYASTVVIPHSRVKEAIAVVLKKEAYIESYSLESGTPKTMTLTLRYVEGKPAITQIKRISKPGRRLYTSVKSLPVTLSGYGITIVTTSQGIMTNKDAKKAHMGGEIICQIF